MIGSEVIRLHTCPDTNNYVAKALENGDYGWGTVILADYQTGGRGRRHKSWQSAPGENLTFSFAMDTSFLPPNRLFLLSKMCTLAMARTLEHFDLPGVAIKWPNDLLVESSKIAGLLIENRGGSKRTSIIGIGLNVNQREFPGLPLATSMRAKHHRLFDRDEVLTVLVEELNAGLKRLLSGQHEGISNDYFKRLYGTGAAVALSTGDYGFGGRILGVEDDGALRIVAHKGFEKRYYLDQVKVEYAN